MNLKFQETALSNDKKKSSIGNFIIYDYDGKTPFAEKSELLFSQIDPYII
jgi:hypothetical protein